MKKIQSILSKLAVGFIVFCLLFWFQDVTFGRIPGFKEIVVLHKFLLKELIFVGVSLLLSTSIIKRFHYLPE